MRNKVIRELQTQAWFPGKVIFDVGANIGQSAKEFTDGFPEARILSFEPIPAAYTELVRATTTTPKVETFQIALGSQVGTLTMTSHGASTGNRVIASAAGKSDVDTVPATTGDRFCEERRIPQIDFLKIDTEGHDLEVVRGFEGMMRRRQITLVQVECGFSPENNRHISFETMNATFLPLGYRLWGVYGLTRRLGRATTRGAAYGDAVYISPES